MVDQETLAFLDARYRKIEDCDDIQAENNSEQKKLALDIAVIKTKLTFLQWIGGTVGAAVLGIAVKYLFGG